MDDDRSPVNADDARRRARGRRRLARGVGVLAIVGYVVLLAVGLYPASASYRIRWEPAQCPVLAGPSGTSTDLQQLWAGETFCPTSNGQRVAMLAALAALAAVAGAAGILRRRWSDEVELLGFRRDVAGVVRVVLVAVLLPMASLVVWRGHDIASIGPREARGSVANGQLCVMLAGGMWHGSAAGMDRDGDGMVAGTIVLKSSDEAAFTSDEPNASASFVRASWPNPRGPAVACAIE